ncbi:MAG: hypothetical protein JJU37_07635 [Balneolaceae bacterium]|nr:hypothetical protein [Balneolaceae bacterium]
MKDIRKKPQPFYSDSFRLSIVRPVANADQTNEQIRSGFLKPMMNLTYMKPTYGLLARTRKSIQKKSFH